MCFTGIPAIILGVLALPGASAAGKTRAYIGIGSGALMTVAGCLIGAFSDPPASTAVTARQTEGAAASVAAPAPIAEPVPVAPPQPAMSASQQHFCDAVNSARDGYQAAQRAGANELKLSKLRSQRKAAVAAAVKGGTVKDWVGTVDSLQTTGEGKAVFVVELPCGSKMGTWNNALSDIMDNSLIPQSSPLYDGIAELNTGTKLRFSGKLVSGDVDGFRESSMTEMGSMTDPFYVIRFTGIGPL